MKSNPDVLPAAGGPELQSALNRARSEAAALAWATGYPMLVLPELVREKEARARRYWFKQQHVRRSSAGFVRNSFNTRRVSPVTDGARQPL